MPDSGGKGEPNVLRIGRKRYNQAGNVGIAIINHAPVITIFMGGINSIKNKGGANDIAKYPH